MIEPIKFEKGFGSVKFDPGLPVDLVRIKGKEVQHARIEPDDYRPRPQSYREIWEPKPVLAINHHTQAPWRLTEDKTLKGNRRFYRGKVVLVVPYGFSPRPIEMSERNQTIARIPTKSHYKMPSDDDIKIVVDGIITRGKDRFRQGELTFALRNKKIRAQEIEAVLMLLVDRYGALKELDTEYASTPTGGRKPSQEYLVLWGESDFFPQKPLQITEETASEESQN